MTGLSALALGLGLGLRHATDADHVLIVTGLVPREAGALRAARIAALWGLGHSATLLTVGLGIVLFDLRFSPRLEHVAEVLVALMLVGFGLWHLRGATEDAAPDEHRALALARLAGGTKSWVEHVAWAPDGARVATASGRTVRLWTPRGEPLVETEPLESTVAGLAWRADGRALAVICYGGVHLLSLEPSVATKHLAFKGSLIALAWSPDARVLACAGQDCSVHIWMLASGREATMEGYRFKPRALSWSGDASLLATSGGEAITVWNFRGEGPVGSRPFVLEGHRTHCTTLTFAPTSDLLASGSADGSVLLWRARGGGRLRRFGFLDGEVTALAFDPSRATLVAADASGTVASFALS